MNIHREHSFGRWSAGAVAGLMLCVAAPAATDPNEGWIEVRSAHFVVASNAGEKDARRIADQFEQIRGLFHAAFGNLRVDPAQPVIILAAKNENTMKLLLPEDWEVKGHVHPAGLYQQGEDKHYVILRLDSGGDNPFHALYHEYTHALLHLNFAALPLWLDEGLAEFYGNSKLGEEESRAGKIDESHLYILSQKKLLPIETLLNVEQGSPYYNEADQASVFYAEAWAVVHYLMLDPEAQREELLKKFIAALDKGATQTEAARETFGDLKRFGQVIESYSRQTKFRIGLFKNGQQAADTTYPVRSLRTAEVLALRGDSASHRNMLEQARPLLEQALQAEPNLAAAHEALGYYLYRKEKDSSADKEMLRAMELGSTSFAPPYYHGMFLLRGGLGTPETLRQAVHSFEKASLNNPRFAPAFEGLAQAYSASPETQEKALEAGIRAVWLDPTTREYVVNLVHLLLNSDRDAEARQLAQRLMGQAISAEDAQVARALLDSVKEHEGWVALRKRRAEEAAKAAAMPAVTAASAPPVVQTAKASEMSIRVDESTLMATDGIVRKIDCSRKPSVTITLGGGNRPLIFRATDFQAIGLSGSDEATMNIKACETWKGRRMRIWFHVAKSKEYMGEITNIAFE
jgi:tetratricopeptide (TPR) repeat protein